MIKCKHFCVFLVTEREREKDGGRRERKPVTVHLPVARGAWRSMVHGVAKSWTRLSDLAQHTQNPNAGGKGTPGIQEDAFGHGSQESGTPKYCLND